MSWPTPRPVRPTTSALSATPMPPGHRDEGDQQRGGQVDEQRLDQRDVCRRRRGRRAPATQANSSSVAMLPPTSCASLWRSRSASAAALTSGHHARIFASTSARSRPLTSSDGHQPPRRRSRSRSAPCACRRPTATRRLEVQAQPREQQQGAEQDGLQHVADERVDQAGDHRGRRRHPLALEEPDAERGLAGRRSATRCSGSRSPASSCRPAGTAGARARSRAWRSPASAAAAAR